MAANADGGSHPRADSLPSPVVPALLLPARPPPPAAPGEEPAADSGDPADAEDDLGQLGWSRSDCWLVFSLAAVCAGLILVQYLALYRGGEPPVQITRLPERENDYRVDINRATWVEFAQLDGLGETLSRRIVADRDQRGPYSSVDDIQRVKGIGAKTLDRLRPFLTCPDLNPAEAGDGTGSLGPPEPAE